MSFTFSDIPADSVASTVSSAVRTSTVKGVSLPGLTNGSTALNGFPVVPGYQSGFIDELPRIDSGLLADPGNNVSAFTSSLTGTKKSIKPVGEWAEMSDGDKRLNIVRSRAAKTLYQNNGEDTYTSDRGPITTMTLLPGPDYDPVKAVEGASSDVSQDVNALIAGRFVNFFVTDLQMSMSEKTQITQTFGDNEVVYYFGRQPIMMNISGLLFDSLENDWFSRFLTLYAGVLRGTQLAKSFSLVQIDFPNMIVKGTVAGISTSQNSARDTDITFQLQFIAKEVVPKPTFMPAGDAQNLVGTLVDFKADREGVAGYTLSSGSLGGGFMDSVNHTIGNVTSGMGGYAGSITGALGGVKGTLDDVLGSGSSVGSMLNSFRTNIFTPVFGVISSITKIVKDVTGTVSSIISSFTNPVNQVLRDISSVAAQASGLALLVENSVNDVIAIPARTVTNYKNTIRSLKNAAGTISRVPENISQTFKRLHSSGRVKRGAAILSSGKAKQKSKAAILTSGAPYVPTKSNTI
jgi:hypothetical protein